MDSKYTVFKGEAIAAISQDGHELPPVGDAVVIRTQDVFAAAGLHAYAHNIRTHIALMRSALLPDLTDSYFALEATEKLESAGDMIERLEGIATYFEECAQEAEERINRGECKVPD